MATLNKERTDFQQIIVFKFKTEVCIRVNKFKKRVNYVAIIRDLYAVSRVHCLLWAINVI